MSELPIEDRFAVLCQITRAQHFAWRQAVAELCPDVDPAKVVERMWEVTGRQTGQAYLKRLDPEQPLAPQVASCIAFSSVCMGEQACAKAGATPDEALVVHEACPWFDWHERLDLLAEDRPGCDRWFATTVETINDALGSKLRVETLESLPDGAPQCTRRLWEAPDD